ncbi:MAG: KamA family radical SAM protein [Deltaproteobacteria bacterium]|nr:KamA family radical SAM protein [Deltaproteobacteria bacterium]
MTKVQRDPHWSDWKWQVRHAVRTPADLAAQLTLTPDEAEGVRRTTAGGLPLTVTPYFMELVEREGPDGPLRRQVVPSAAEWTASPGERDDPLGEEALLAAPSLVHRYPDRALLWATDRCASYCRFCTRKRLVGQGPTPTESDVADGIDYIARTPSIRDVIISGGDALLLDDDKLVSLVARLRGIRHVDVIRLATRMVAFCPMRITLDLLHQLRAFQPVYFLLHFNHPAELTPEVTAALARLADHGFPLLNQSVLLRGINDRVDVLEALFRTLARLRCRPYYLHQCDAITGAAHFRTTLDSGLDLVDALRGRVSGLALPTYVVDVPGGRGKVPLARDPRVSREGGLVRLRGSLGGTADYPEPSDS